MSMLRLRKVAAAIAAALSGAVLVIIARIWGAAVAAETIGAIVVVLLGFVYLRSAGALRHISGIAGAGTFSASGTWLPNILGAAEVLGGVTDSFGSLFGLRTKGAPAEEDQNKIEALDRAIAKLPTGDVAVTAPPRMKVGESREVTVQIATADHAQFLANIAAADEKRVVDTTKVGNTMRVELIASKDAFDILPIGEPVQAFGGSATWSFEITAKRAGNQVLRVMIAVVVQLSGRSQEHPYHALVKEIEISVRVAYVRTFLRKGRYVLWALGGMVVTFVLSLDPVKAVAVDLINHYIGAHLGFHLPTTKT